MRDVHVAVTSDERYAMPLAAMLASLVAHLAPDRHLVIHAFLSELAPATWERLHASVAADRVTWQRMSLPASELTRRGFATRAYEHVSAVTFFRLLLPALLPTLSKVLYLDSDMIVRADVTPLWDTELVGAPLAAVPEQDPRSRCAGSPAGIRRYRELGLDASQPLFNAGVLLIDLDAWRRLHIGERAFAYLRAAGPDVRWYEQEALNVVSAGAYRSLNPQWNRPASAAAALPRHDSAIVHYLTGHKPWHSTAGGPCGTVFYDALDRTAWAGWRPSAVLQSPAWRAGRHALKMLRKRTDALRRHAWHAGRWLAHRAARPRRVMLQGAGWDRNGGEIRGFVCGRSLDPLLLTTIRGLVAAGCDRIVVLLEAPPQAPATLTALAHPVAVFTAPDRSGHALRQLLDRFGAGCWCAMLRSGEQLASSDGAGLDLRAVSALLEATGVNIAIASPSSAASTTPCRVAARDARTNALFIGEAHVQWPATPHAEPAFTMRVVLVRHTQAVRLDATMHVWNQARAHATVLALTPGAA